MKRFIEIFIIFLVLSLHLSFQSVESFEIRELNHRNSSSESLEIAEAQSDNSCLATKKNSTQENPIEYSIKSKIIKVKPVIKSINFFEVQTYQRKNDLCFNLPLICYKFPLSEHTDEG